MLWGRAAQRCAFPDCRKELVMDATQTDDESLIGEDCHIVAQANAGPRGTQSLSDDEKILYADLIRERDKYANLILLCNIHHKVIDDQSNFYTVERIKQMKTEHEMWVREALQGFDAAKQRDHEVYATYIEKWADLVDLDNWLGWSSFVFSSGGPHIRKEQFDQLEQLLTWILGRVWPKRYPELEAAFTNFMRVLNDFKETLLRYANEEFSQGWLWTESFYKRDWNNNRLLDDYNFHVALVKDLMLELTRAGNYICDRVRQYIDSSYRLEEGVILVQPTDGLTYRTLRPEYRGEQRVLNPYVGLKQFKEDRFTREFYFGRDTSVEETSIFDDE